MGCVPLPYTSRCGVHGLELGGLPTVVPPGVVPIAFGRNETGRNIKVYKRCRWRYRQPPRRKGANATKSGFPRRQHLEFFDATPKQRERARGAEWVSTPLLLATDKLNNVGHAVRDHMFMNAFARRWARRSGALSSSAAAATLRYHLLTSRPTLPWVEEFAEAVAKHHGIAKFEPAKRRAYCFDAVLQKGMGISGDAEDVRELRDAAHSHCGAVARGVSLLIGYEPHTCKARNLAVAQGVSLLRAGRQRRVSGEYLRIVGVTV